MSKRRKNVNMEAPPDLELEIKKMEGIANCLEQQRNINSNDAAKISGQLQAQVLINQRLEKKVRELEAKVADLSVKKKDVTI